MITLYVNKADGAMVDAMRFPHDSQKKFMYHTLFSYRIFI